MKKNIVKWLLVNLLVIPVNIIRVLYVFFDKKYFSKYTPKNGDEILSENEKYLTLIRKGELLKVNKFTNRFEFGEIVLPSKFDLYNKSKNYDVIDLKNETNTNSNWLKK